MLRRNSKSDFLKEKLNEEGKNDYKDDILKNYEYRYKKSKNKSKFK